MANEKQNKLKELSEEQFRQDVLIPLLKRMGYQNVRERHGSKEYGKDITFCERSELGTTYYAVVVKAGDISGAASKRTNAEIVSTVINQVKMCFDMPLDDITDEMAKDRTIDVVIVWCSGNISGNARDQIIRGRSSGHIGSVKFKDLEATIDHLDQRFPEYFTIGDATLATYSKNAKYECSKLDELSYIGEVVSRKNLSNIFVSPTLQRVTRVKTKQEIQENRPPREYSADYVRNLKHNVVLLGDIGSGKTTLLRQMVLTAINENQDKLSAFPLPVYVRIKNINFQLEEPVETAIYAEFNRLSENLEARLDLHANNTLILLDGLDELKSDDVIRIAVDAIQFFARQFTKAKVVVTSRSLEMFKTTEILSSFYTFRIQNMKVNQIEQFLTNWFGKNTQDGREVIKLVTGPTTLTMIWRTPLTLALIAVLYEAGYSELPANLTELYAKYTELALGRWDKRRDISTTFEWKIKQLILRQISWKMQMERKLDTSISGMVALIDQIQDEKGLSFDSRIIAGEIIERSGLFTIYDGALEFKHRAFLHYFAGLELDSDPTSISIINEHIFDGWWSWTIFFAAGTYPDREEYLTAVVNNLEVNRENAFAYSYHLGLLVQACYLADVKAKTEAVKKVINSLILSWDYNIEEIEKDDTIRSNHHWSQPMYLSFYVFMLMMVINSRTLSKATQALVEEILDNHLSYSLTLEDAHKDWYVFFVSVCCYATGNSQGFEELYKSKLITNPLFLEFALAFLDDFAEDEAVSLDVKHQLNELKKMLRRKVKASNSDLVQIKSSRPKLLNPRGDAK